MKNIPLVISVQDSANPRRKVAEAMATRVSRHLRGLLATAVLVLGFALPKQAAAQTAPVISAPTSASIASTTATLGGNVTADGGSAINERGVVFSPYNSNADPLIGGTSVTKTSTTGTTGVFTVPVTSLAAGTRYAFKAYAINAAGTSYTTAATFITPVPVGGGGPIYVSNNNNGTVSKVAAYGTATVFATPAGSSGLTGITQDSLGNVFVASYENHIIFKITPAGVVSTFATSAQGLNNPEGLAIGPSDDLYVANYNAGSVLKFTPAGGVSTYVSGLVAPTGLAFDAAGDLYISQFTNNNVVKYHADSGLTTFASGLNGPWDMIFDAAGNLFVAEVYGGTVRKFTPAGVGSVFASGLNDPRSIALDATGNIFVATFGNSSLYKYDASGTGGLFTTSTINGPLFINNGRGLTAAALLPTVTTPTSSAITSTTATLGGNVTDSGYTAVFERGVVFSPYNTDADPLIGDSGVTKTSTTGTTGVFTLPVTSLAGGTRYAFKAYATNAAGTSYSTTGTFITPVPVSGGGPIYVSNFGNGTVSKVAADGTATVFATVAAAYTLTGITQDSSGNVFVASLNASTIFKITPAGVVSTFATGTQGLSSPYGLAIDSSDNLYVANNGTNSVLKFTPAGAVSTYVSGLVAPRGLAFDSAGDLYICQFSASSVVKYSVGSGLTTFASGLDSPWDMIFDAAGNLYVAEAGTNQVRKITPAGVLSVFVSSLIAPRSFALDATGNIYVAIYGDSSLRKYDISGTGGLFTTSTINAPLFINSRGLPLLPTVTTPTSSAVNITTATLGGNVTDSGYTAVFERGVVYAPTSTNGDPLIGGTGVIKAATTGTTGVFTLPVASLSSNTGYSFKAYATNAAGTSYTSVATFTTVPPTSPPTVTTPTATSIATYSAVLGGTLSATGNLTVTARGVVYSRTSVNPAPLLSGSGVIPVNDAVNATGAFSFTVTGLTGGVSYSYAAYATNSLGTTYTSPVSTFTTSQPATTVTAGVTAPPGATPGSTLTGTTFASIRSGMVIASSGALAYRGYLTTGTGGVDANNFMGLWKSPDGTAANTVLTARSGDIAPGSSNAFFDVLPLNPVINNAGQVTFPAFLRVNTGSPAATLASDSAVWSELGSGTLALLLREGTAITGGTATTIAPTTWVATGATRSAFTVKLGTAGSALVRGGFSGTTPVITTIATEGGAAPAVGGGNAGTFDSFMGNATDPRMDAADDLAFLGYLQTSGIGRIFYQSAAGSLTALVATGQTVPSLASDTITTLDRPSLGSSTGIAFRAFLTTSGQAVFKGSPATPAGIVPVAVSNYTATQIPTIPAGSKLWSIWAPFTNGLNHIAFRVSMLDAAGAETRAILTDTGGTLRLIAKVGDTAPGLAAGDTFANFDHPIIGDGDQAAFIASTTSGVVGLWRQATGGGALSLVMKIGDTILINGTSETIAEITIPGSTSDDRKYETRAMDNTGRILAHLTYSSGKTGIQLTLP